MSLKSTATSLTLTLGLAASPAVAAGAVPCVSEDDEMALNTRVLQTELMVAALSCDEQQRYNAFVTNYRSLLATQSASLRAWFRRAYGTAGERELNSFVTRLANDESKRSADTGERYCASAAALMAETLATDPSDFENLTRKTDFTSRHGFSRCN